MQTVAAAYWDRVEAQASGRLLNERVAAERAIDRIMSVMVEEIFPDWLRKMADGDEVVRPTLKQKDKVTREIRECFKLCQLTSADTKLFGDIMDRLAPRLQQVEHRAEVTHNHVVMLPETQTPEKWIEGEVE